MRGSAQAAGCTPPSSSAGGGLNLGPPRAGLTSGGRGPGPDRLTAHGPASAAVTSGRSRAGAGPKLDGGGLNFGPQPVTSGRGHLGPIFEGSRPGGLDLMATAHGPPRRRPPRAGLTVQFGPRAGPLSRAEAGRRRAGLTAHGPASGRKAQDRAAEGRARRRAHLGPRAGLKIGAAEGLDLIGSRLTAHLGPFSAGSPRGRRAAAGPT